MLSVFTVQSRRSVLPPLQGGMLVLALPGVTLRSPPAILWQALQAFKLQLRAAPF